MWGLHRPLYQLHGDLQFGAKLRILFAFGEMVR
jgi:hypothetical protein